MEIVKKLEGPTPEEVKFDFEEKPFPLYEEENTSKKGIILTFIILTCIGVLGYFSVKNFNENEKKDVNRTKEITNLKPTTIVKEVKIPIAAKEDVKVVIYTEELAQEIKPKTGKEIKIKAPVKTVKIIQETIKELKVPEKIYKTKKMKTQIETRKTRIVTIRKGDTLNKLSKRFYGSPSQFKRIIRANKRIKSYKTPLKAGQKVVIPYKRGDSKRRFIIVKKGYNLAYISKNIYGTSDKIKKIINANYRIKSAKSKLRIGQKIYVPK